MRSTEGFHQNDAPGSLYKASAFSRESRKFRARLASS